MNDRIEKRIELKAPVFAGLARADGLPGVWRVVSCQTGRPIRARPVSLGTLTYPGYEHLKWEAVRAKWKPERSFLTWHPYASRPQNRLFERDAHAGRIQAGEDQSGTCFCSQSPASTDPTDRRAEAFRMNDGGWTEQ